MASFPWWAAVDLAVIFVALTSPVWVLLLVAEAAETVQDWRRDREARAIAARVRGGR